jgi:peptidyl-tRNA hydrolase, PTH2 family
LEVTVKQVIIIRTDLGMPKGKMIAQGAHASMQFMVNDLKWWIKTPLLTWSNEGMAKIVLGTDSLDVLDEIHSKALNAGMLAYFVVDSGKTTVPPGSVTALAIGPADNEELDKITGKETDYWKRKDIRSI